MRTEIVRTLPEGDWRRFVEGHPDGNIFHTPELFRVFARTKGQRPALWAAVDGSGRPLALLVAVDVTVIDGPLRRLTTRAVAYGSTLHAPGAHGLAALSHLLETYKQTAGRAALFTELRNLSDLSSAQAVLHRQGFVYEDHLNYLIDLDRPADQLLQSLGKRTRRAIRKGLREGRVEVSEVRDRRELELWYRGLQATYDRAAVPLADRSLFEAAFAELPAKGMIKLLVATVAGEIAACSAELVYKDAIYGWYGGSTRAYGKFAASEMLMWHVLEWGSTHGYRVYDFGGAGKPGEPYGVRDFKAKFGGRLVCFGRNTCVHAPALLKLSEWGYGIYRRLFL